jgi:hypothetical protein
VGNMQAVPPVAAGDAFLGFRDTSSGAFADKQATSAAPQPHPRHHDRHLVPRLQGRLGQGASPPARHLRTSPPARHLRTPRKQRERSLLRAARR